MTAWEFMSWVAALTDLLVIESVLKSDLESAQRSNATPHQIEGILIDNIKPDVHSLPSTVQ